MSGYIASFTVYTMAIIGFLFLAFVVTKKSIASGNLKSKKDRFLSIETSLDLAPRKTLHVVKAGNEKFLISADAERTNFLTKLEDSDILPREATIEKPAYIATKETTINKNVEQKTAMMRGILEKMGT